MMSAVYFKDKFLSHGTTDIMDADGQVIGMLDLHSMFNSGVTVRDLHGEPQFRGRFRFLSGWQVLDAYDGEVGVLKTKFAFLKQRFRYQHERLGEFEIEAPAFSKEYTLYSPGGREAARFRRVSGAFQAGAYELTNSSELSTEELIVVVMGIHAFLQQQQSAGST